MLFSFVIFVVIMVFEAINDQSVIDAIFQIAGYTYGPLLGLYSFGLFTGKNVHDRLVPWIAVVSPVITYIINANSEDWLFGYKFNFELLILNGAITFLGLWLIRKK